MNPADIPAEAGFTAQITEHVVTVTLNRPERRNAQTPLTWRALDDLARSVPGTVRVAVLRAQGPSFSAGLDRAMFAPGELSAVTGELIGQWQRAFDWMSRPALTSVAAVQGHAIGAGFQLALGADLRVVADDVQFAMAEPSLGVVPDMGGTKRLVDLVGYSRAVELCLTGRRIDAAEALAIGLANAVVPAAELDDAVGALVQALLAVDRDAATETKALLLAATCRSQGDQQAAEADAQTRRIAALLGRDE